MQPRLRALTHSLGQGFKHATRDAFGEFLNN